MENATHMFMVTKKAVLSPFKRSVLHWINVPSGPPDEMVLVLSAPDDARRMNFL
jgi:hypothetical protein